LHVEHEAFVCTMLIFCSLSLPVGRAQQSDR
jgi:hypothetical protein